MSPKVYRPVVLFLIKDQSNELANDSRAGMSVDFIRLRMVTRGSTISMFGMVESISFITRPADGAQEPFSMIATLRLQ